MLSKETSSPVAELTWGATPTAYHKAGICKKWRVFSLEGLSGTWKARVVLTNCIIVFVVYFQFIQFSIFIYMLHPHLMDHFVLLFLNLVSGFLFFFSFVYVPRFVDDIAAVEIH